MEDVKDPDTCNVFSLYRLVANQAEQAELAAKYRAGGMGYGEAKKSLLAKLEEFFAPYQSKRAELLNNLDHVEKILQDGAAKARAVAQQTMANARQACGIR